MGTGLAVMHKDALHKCLPQQVAVKRRAGCSGWLKTPGGKWCNRMHGKEQCSTETGRSFLMASGIFVEVK
jgi:hypothetical protein